MGARHSDAQTGVLKQADWIVVDEWSFGAGAVRAFSNSSEPGRLTALINGNSFGGGSDRLLKTAHPEWSHAGSAGGEHAQARMADESGEGVLVNLLEKGGGGRRWRRIRPATRWTPEAGCDRGFTIPRPGLSGRREVRIPADHLFKERGMGWGFHRRKSALVLGGDILLVEGRRMAAPASARGVTHGGLDSERIMISNAY